MVHPTVSEPIGNWSLSVVMITKVCYGWEGEEGTALTYRYQHFVATVAYFLHLRSALNVMNLATCQAR